MNMIRSSLVVLILLTLVTGFAYPLLVTGLANALYPWQAGGSLIEKQGRILGSALIGQSYQDASYFQGRPSVTADLPYNTLSSGGSNLAVSNPKLTEIFKTRVEALQSQNPQTDGTIPVDLITASASGLDPDISLNAALYQVPRIAKLRQLSEAELISLIKEQTTSPLVSFLGQPVVNVLKLNMALDEYQSAPAKSTH